MLNPATNSDSASGKSNGILFDSAKRVINATINKRGIKDNKLKGIKLIKNQPFNVTLISLAVLNKLLMFLGMKHIRNSCNGNTFNHTALNSISNEELLDNKASILYENTFNPKYNPAITIVLECKRAEIGVGAIIAFINQLEKGN